MFHTDLSGSFAEAPVYSGREAGAHESPGPCMHKANPKHVFVACLSCPLLCFSCDMSHQNTCWPLALDCPRETLRLQSQHIDTGEIL